MVLWLIVVAARDIGDGHAAFAADQDLALLWCRVGFGRRSVLAPLATLCGTLLSAPAGSQRRNLRINALNICRYPCTAVDHATRFSALFCTRRRPLYPRRSPSEYHITTRGRAKPEPPQRPASEASECNEPAAEPPGGRRSQSSRQRAPARRREGNCDRAEAARGSDKLKRRQWAPARPAGRIEQCRRGRRRRATQFAEVPHQLVLLTTAPFYQSGRTDVLPGGFNTLTEGASSRM
jgi:hypothetical protein